MPTPQSFTAEELHDAVLLAVIARAIRGAGAAAVLACIDALPEKGMRATRLTLERFGKL
jgi:hypothetical protein